MLAHAVDGHPAWNTQINSPGRFTVLTQFNKEAIFDKETGLVWEKSPTPGAVDWETAYQSCLNKIVDNRKGWRLPTVQELASLIDLTQSDPSLPDRHPFSNMQLGGYWSATTWAYFPSDAWMVTFIAYVYGSGSVVPEQKLLDAHYWCVRGGQGVDPQ
jgi:hypothetical protein